MNNPVEIQLKKVFSVLFRRRNEADNEIAKTEALCHQLGHDKTQGPNVPSNTDNGDVLKINLSET